MAVSDHLADTLWGRVQVIVKEFLKKGHNCHCCDHTAVSYCFLTKWSCLESRTQSTHRSYFFIRVAVSVVCSCVFCALSFFVIVASCHVAVCLRYVLVVSSFLVLFCSCFLFCSCLFVCLGVCHRGHGSGSSC